MIVISVIIATYNRAALLQQQLSALKNQDFEPAGFEIVIVDDGSTDQTSEVVNTMQKGMSNITYLRQENQGPAVARNYAASIASGSIIAFTDDDCIVDSNWLSTIYKSFHDTKILALQGRTTTIKRLVTPLTHQVINEHGDTSIPTCNAAYRKSAFEQLGGFDNGFPFQNEDADLSWRIREMGQVKFVPEMHVLHPPRTDSFKKNACKMNHLISEFMLYYKNPMLYKKHRANSPWVTIYWLVMIKAQGYHFTRRIKYIRQPLIMLQGILLSIIWWGQLFMLLPEFWRSKLRYQRMYQPK